LKENGYDVDTAYILRIGREESEGFEFVKIPDMNLHVERFLTCRKLYDLNSRLRRAGW